MNVRRIVWTSLKKIILSTNVQWFFNEFFSVFNLHLHLEVFVRLSPRWFNGYGTQISVRELSSRGFSFYANRQKSGCFSTPTILFPLFRMVELRLLQDLRTYYPNNILHSHDYILLLMTISSKYILHSHDYIFKVLARILSDTIVVVLCLVVWISPFHFCEIDGKRKIEEIFAISHSDGFVTVFLFSFLAYWFFLI